MREQTWDGIWRVCQPLTVHSNPLMKTVWCIWNGLWDEDSDDRWLGPTRRGSIFVFRDGKIHGPPCMKPSGKWDKPLDYSEEAVFHPYQSAYYRSMEEAEAMCVQLGLNYVISIPVIEAFREKEANNAS